MKAMKARIGAGLALAAIAAYFAFIYFAGPKVDAARVVRRDIVQSVVASGRVARPHRVDIGAQVIGTVKEVPVAEGATVKAGQLLVVLESTEARAAQRETQATFNNARAQFERNSALHQKGFIGAAALDDARRALDVSRTQMDAARARIGYLHVKAPLDGTLIARDVERGDVVQPGKVLMVLSPAGATQLVLQIDERNLGRVARGQKALASADAYPTQRFGATLAYINPGVDAQRGTVEVKLDVPSSRRTTCAQDMTVSVDIETARHAGCWCFRRTPCTTSAVGAVGARACDGGHALRQAVKLGLRGDGRGRDGRRAQRGRSRRCRNANATVKRRRSARAACALP